MASKKKKVAKKKKKEFDPEGSGFDEKGARAAGAKRDAKGHFGSFDPRDGKLLKGIKHPSIDSTRIIEKRLGNKIVKKKDGRYYSVPIKKKAK